jgi:peptidoglycan/LPS O-acetylase OafA/YrhL
VLGERSYSIYLMHMPMVMVFEIATRRMESPVLRLGLVVVYIALLVLISGWTFRYVERPFRDLFNRLAKHQPRPAAEPALAKD